MMDKIEYWLIRITIALILLVFAVQIGIHKGREMSRSEAENHKEVTSWRLCK